uniref:Zinc finger translocation associated n=1 Tax=Gadus morhua TaxID=8049 RepID=A0A8C5CLR5_GADMO
MPCSSMAPCLSGSYKQRLNTVLGRLAVMHSRHPAEASGGSRRPSYDGPDQPLLLSPAPGPSGGGGGKAPRVPRASRQGLSRIPGRDHRRYYHEYWRSEYLMDFDRLRQGMICMVCGSSLATLKLSTIKRHIRQKHPDSLLWSPADKEVIRSGWESHLGLGGAHKPFFPPEEEEEVEEEEEEEVRRRTEEPMKVETTMSTAGTGVEEPSARTLERYLNDSLHAWFRQEFLMEYEAPAAGTGVSRLLCMVCGGQPHSLHLDHIKGHVLERHPDSLVYSAEEKHRVLQAWAGPFIKSERDTKDPEAGLSPQDAGYIQGGYALPPGHAPLTQDPGGVGGGGGLIGEDGIGGFGGAVAGTPDHRGPRGRGAPRRRRLRGGEPWRLRLDYLVAYGPQGRGTYCMVCSQALAETKVSGFRRHIQESHPETGGLGRKELPRRPRPGEEGEQGGAAAPGSCAAAASSRHTHYPGKDQRRNYQVRWRQDFLMDYDCRRHGLICMVCGSTLATLKVSTIKRHIQQVHPQSLAYDAGERQNALLCYGRAAERFVHADDCFAGMRSGGTCEAAGRGCRSGAVDEGRRWF